MADVRVVDIIEFIAQLPDPQLCTLQELITEEFTRRTIRDSRGLGPLSTNEPRIPISCARIYDSGEPYF